MTGQNEVVISMQCVEACGLGSGRFDTGLSALLTSGFVAGWQRTREGYRVATDAAWRAPANGGGSFDQGTVDVLDAIGTHLVALAVPALGSALALSQSAHRPAMAPASTFLAAAVMSATAPIDPPAIAPAGAAQ